jgi:hypothetical protein
MDGESIMGFLDSIFGGGQQAAAEEQARAAEMAMRERRAAEQRARQDLSPYTQSGKNNIPLYQNAINEMQDQPGFLDSILKQYQPSAGYERRFNEGNRAITQGYGANGMYGSGDYMKALMQNGQGLADQDQQQYLNNILGIRSGYMGGLEGNVNRGFNAASNIGNIAANTGQGLAGDQLNLGQANANSQLASSNMLNGILSLGGSTLFGGLNNLMGGNEGIFGNNGMFGKDSFGRGALGGFKQGLGIYGQGLGMR